MPAFVESAGSVRRLEIEFHASCTPGAGETGKASRRVHRATGSARCEDVRRSNRDLDFVHAIRHFPEPDHVRPKPSAPAPPALSTGLPSRFLPPAMSAGAASGGPDLAVHVDDPLRAGLLVEVVDVLGYEYQMPVPFSLEPRERKMGRVRPGVPVSCKPLAVEFQYPKGVSVKCLRRRDILDPDLTPDPALVSECAQPGLGGNACPRQDHDPACHRPLPLLSACRIPLPALYFSAE